jgi:hypothetical protein
MLDLEDPFAANDLVIFWAWDNFEGAHILEHMDLSAAHEFPFGSIRMGHSLLVGAWIRYGVSVRDISMFCRLLSQLV